MEVIAPIAAVIVAIVNLIGVVVGYLSAKDAKVAGTQMDRAADLLNKQYNELSKHVGELIAKL